LPIPKANKTDQDKIGNLVSNILELKKANTDNDTIEIEKKIDQLVYQLYNLTAEEIEIIENGVK